MAYAIIIKVPNIPDEEVSEYVKKVRGLNGFIGMAPEYPNKLVLFFETKRDAKKARKKLGA